MSRNASKSQLWRSRWAAFGAAIAVTLGGGGVLIANAASSPASSVITVDPFRILDTREPQNIGLPGPFVSTTPQNLQITGTVVPTGATGVLLNATVVEPSAAGFISIRPGDATGAPTTSSLNFQAGETIPNSVQVGLPTTGANAGQIEITYDAYGVSGPTTDLLIDVVGYLMPGAGGAAGPEGPAGPQGPVGATGPAGAPGASYLVEPGQASFAAGTDTVGVRFKSQNSGGEVFLGVNDLGMPGNRVEANTIWPDGRRPFTFAFDGINLTTSLPGATGVVAVNLTRMGATCAAPDLLQVRLRASGAGATTTETTNLVVNKVPLGGFGPATSDTGDYFTPDQYFTITGDFSGPFQITGLLDTKNWSAGNESNQLQLTVGCSS